MPRLAFALLRRRVNTLAQLASRFARRQTVASKSDAQWNRLGRLGRPERNNTSARKTTRHTITKALAAGYGHLSWMKCSLRSPKATNKRNTSPSILKTNE